MKTYPARIWNDDNGSWSVEFVDLPGCFSWGASLGDAKLNAAEALTAGLESLDARGLPAPAPSAVSGKNIHQVAPKIRDGQIRRS